MKYLHAYLFANQIQYMYACGLLTIFIYYSYKFKFFQFFNVIFQPFWKQMGQNFIERYLYLIIFTAYLIERSPR